MLLNFAARYDDDRVYTADGRPIPVRIQVILRASSNASFSIARCIIGGVDVRRATLTVGTMLATRYALLAIAITALCSCASSATPRGPSGAPAPSGASAPTGTPERVSAIPLKSGLTSRDAILAATRGGAAGAVIGHQMDQQAIELRSMLSGTVVERVGEGIQVTVPASMLFEGASDAILSNGAKELRDLATSLKEYPGTNIVIVGHSDVIGASGESSLSVTERQARATYDYLRIQGVVSPRMRFLGRGHAEVGRQVNRRVEIAIYTNEPRPARRP